MLATIPWAQSALARPFSGPTHRVSWQRSQAPPPSCQPSTKFGFCNFLSAEQAVVASLVAAPPAWLPPQQHPPPLPPPSAAYAAAVADYSPPSSPPAVVPAPEHPHAPLRYAPTRDELEQPRRVLLHLWPPSGARHPEDFSPEANPQVAAHRSWAFPMAPPRMWSAQQQTAGAGIQRPSPMPHGVSRGIDGFLPVESLGRSSWPLHLGGLWSASADALVQPPYRRASSAGASTQAARPGDAAGGEGEERYGVFGAGVDFTISHGAAAPREGVRAGRGPGRVPLRHHGSGRHLRLSDITAEFGTGALYACLLLDVTIQAHQIQPR